jgi:glycosyltransferase involved in cell wall biosynthesis
MTKRVRILRVIARMNLGGPAMAVTTLMNGVDDSEFEQLLVTGFCAQDEEDYLDSRAPDLPHVRVIGLGRAPHAWNDVSAGLQLARIARQFRPDIVHTHTAKAGALGRAAVGQRRGVRSVHTFHGHLLKGYFSPPVLRAVIATERLLAHRTDALISVGSQVRDELLNAGIGRPDQYTVMSPGLSLPAGPGSAAARHALGIPVDAPVIGFVARLAQVKRPDRFADVVLRVAATIPDLHVVICGGGELAAELTHRLEPFGDRAHLLGWRTDVEAVYDACDVIALTSDNEGMPVSLIEAGLAGKPSVTTDVGSVKEVVLHGKTGFVVSDETAFVEQLVCLLQNKPLAQRLGEAAKQHTMTRFSKTRLSSDTTDLYRTLSSPPRRGVHASRAGSGRQ